MDLIENFFNKEFESKINSQLQNLNYIFPKDAVVDYINDLCKTPIEDFLHWIDQHTFYTLDATDMPQISKFEDSFYGIINELIKHGDKGFRFIEMGCFLQNDGIERNDVANRKYGENHAKTAEYIGYLYSLKFYYYVSCYGYALQYLNEEQRDKLYARLLIRTNLFKSVYLLSKKGKFNFYDLFDMVSYSTYKRRMPGTKMILESINKIKEYDFSPVLSKIIYKSDSNII